MSQTKKFECTPVVTDHFKISSQGFQTLLQKLKQQPQSISPNQNIVWTDDVKFQLPIKLTKDGIGALMPTTIIQQFQRTVKQKGDWPAQSQKIKGHWKTLNFSQYYEQCFNFARSLIALGMNQNTGVNIIGFNSPQWSISFLGSMFAKCLPIGVYSTNSKAVCQYLATHSQSKVVIAQNQQCVQKYIELLQNKVIEYIIVYSDTKVKYPSYSDRVIQWSDFIKLGKRVQPIFVQKRMKKVKPGTCCTLVYTSGTTGMPKGVMLSHDNYTWTKKALQAYNDQYRPRDKNKKTRMVSYLPLSHVAAQFADIIGPMMEGIHVYYAQPSALQGTLIQTLIQVRPNYFFSVPRVWEKIYDKMQQIARSNGWLKTKIATWAKSIGQEGCSLTNQQKETSFQFKIANLLVYKNVKKALGLDEADYLFFGAAPLDPQIRKYFKTLNFYLINSFGMSQTTGPQNFSHPDFQPKKPEQYRQVGKNLPGTQIKIVPMSQNEQQGEICFRGRNIFMGYYKNAQQTRKVIDSQGFLHSGDMGKITLQGVLFITGRAKELIITAGGQNVPPVLIQNQIRSALPFIGNVMVVGDMKKFLTCLISLKQDPVGSGKIEKGAKQYLQLKGINIQTVQDGLKDEKVRKLINQGLKKANEKSVSRAQHVQRFHLLRQDFSVQNGLLTPTLKLKRREVIKRYNGQIQQMYLNPSL